MSLNSGAVKELVISVSVAAGAVYLLKHLCEPSKTRLPPGPKGFPVIGNLLSMPRSSEHIVYKNMSKELDSDIIALSVMGQTIVVLNSIKVASELLDKRSSIYSSRAQIPVVCDKNFMDWGQGVVFLNNNDRWRRDRRMLHDAMHKGAVPRHHPGQEKQVHALIGRLLNTPSTLEAFVEEISFALGAGIMHAVYGYTPKSKGDKWLRGATEATENIAQAAQPTKFMVNFLPALKYLPDWFPGTGWKRVINEWKEHKEYVTSAPYSWTKEQIRNGSAIPSIVQNILSAFPDHTPDAEDDLHIKLMSAIMFGGGLDTTTATTMVFLLAMVLYPNVALKLQAELDQVLGDAERLPVVQDREHMPYTQNSILEVLRWQPVNPLAVPHATTNHDVYNGYHIPKGSIVIGNTWAIARDESVYPDPECFNPDRFLDPEVPPAPAFGYGRRICPGSHFAEANLFLLISSLVYVFEIRRAVDENGEEIVPEVKMALDSTLVCKPQSFEFVMKPRSDAHRKLAMGFGY